ncbi:hypothetical protein QYE76_053624 [Lolium multiflorum]|uniref:Uncharacterized protein n=1 Tax=Lolium multiflorum TaxID=4521 RepID=A0AAD8SX01_LOLMU|nr:hypothetical protein QYE76_053624 [Lolium multiflorum]
MRTVTDAPVSVVISLRLPRAHLMHRCGSHYPSGSRVRLRVSRVFLATWRPKARTVAGREANRRGPAVSCPPSLSFINTTAPSSSSSSHSSSFAHSAPRLRSPPFFVRRRSLKLRRPANSRRASAGLRCAEIFGSNFTAPAAFALLRELLRLAVDGARRRPQGKEIPKPKPPVECGSCIVGSRQGSTFLKFSGLESCRAWQGTFFYVKNSGRANLIDLPPYQAGPPSRTNWSYNPKTDHAETNRVVRFLASLKKETNICSDDIIRTFISRRVLPLKRRAHRMSEMYGPGDPTKITGRPLSKKDVVRKAKQICQTAMPFAWEWGLLPLSSSNPPTQEAKDRFPLIQAERRGTCRKRALDSFDPDPYIFWKDLKMGKTPAARLGRDPPEPTGTSDDLTVLEIHERVPPLRAEAGSEFVDKLMAQGQKNKQPASTAGSSHAPPSKRFRTEPVGEKEVGVRRYGRKAMPTASGPALKLGPRPSGSEGSARTSTPPPRSSPAPSATSVPEKKKLPGGRSLCSSRPRKDNFRAGIFRAGRLQSGRAALPLLHEPSSCLRGRSAPSPPGRSYRAAAKTGAASPRRRQDFQAHQGEGDGLQRPFRRPAAPGAARRQGRQGCRHEGHRPPWPHYGVPAPRPGPGAPSAYAQKWNAADMTPATRGLGKDRLPAPDPVGDRSSEEHFMRLRSALTADARKALFEELLWEHRELAEAHDKCQVIPEASIDALKEQLAAAQREKDQLSRQHQEELNAHKTSYQELKSQLIQLGLDHAKALKTAEANAAAKLDEALEDASNATKYAVKKVDARRKDQGQANLTVPWTPNDHLVALNARVSHMRAIDRNLSDIPDVATQLFRTWPGEEVPDTFSLISDRLKGAGRGSASGVLCCPSGADSALRVACSWYPELDLDALTGVREGEETDLDPILTAKRQDRAYHIAEYAEMRTFIPPPPDVKDYLDEEEDEAEEELLDDAGLAMLLRKPRC